MTPPIPSPQPLTPIYVSDLDGTFLRADESVDPIKIDKFNQLLADGLLFTAASARSYVSLKSVLPLNLTLPVIDSNGAFLTDFQTGEHLLINSLDSDMGAAIYAQAVAAGHYPFVTSFDGTADKLTYTQTYNNATAWYVDRRTKRNDPRLRQRDNMSAVLQEEIVSFILLSDEKASLVALQTQLKETYGEQLIAYISDNEYSASYWLVIQDKSATKANAIQSLRKRYGYTENELVVFGDQLNDLPMFAVADRKYAVENAMDELKERATAVIGHHNNSAVLDFIIEEQTRG